MSISITLKNVPDELYARLKATAKAHRRSINQEVIVCLETTLAVTRMPPAQRLNRIRALRQNLPMDTMPPDAIDSAKRAGRT